MVARRLLVILAVFMGLSVVAASVQPPVRESDSPEGPRETPAAAAEPEARLVRFRADGPRKRVVVEVGRPVRVEVAVAEPASVQLGAEGEIDAAAPESPARFDVYFDAPVTREVALLEPRRVIGRITAER